MKKNKFLSALKFIEFLLVWGFFWIISLIIDKFKNVKKSKGNKIKL